MNDFNIPIPSGYVIDVEKSSLETGVIKFKKAPILNWEDFIDREKLEGYVELEDFYDRFDGGKSEFYNMGGVPGTLKGYTNFKGPIFANINEAKSITALIKLMLVRSVYIGNWKPNWNDPDETKYVIGDNGKIVVITYHSFKCSLSFPTEEMAKLFLENNKELLEEYFNFQNYGTDF